MKRIALAIAALAAICAHGAPDDSAVANRKWVRSLLRDTLGVRISAATVSTNVTPPSVPGGAAVTNITVSSPYSCPEVPDCVAVSFVMSPARRLHAAQSARAVRPSWLDLIFLSAVADGAVRQTIRMTVHSGMWTDKYGKANRFDLGGGLELDSRQELPEMPPSAHVCALDADCNCMDEGNEFDPQTKTVNFDIPDEYAELDDGAEERFRDPWNWFDKETWPNKSTIGDDTIYWLLDENGQRFNLEHLAAHSDAWAEAVKCAIGEVNGWMAECRVAYCLAHICTAKNPQHDWPDSPNASCGAYRWYECRNNPAHTKGSKGHEYAGGTGDAISHPCKCGATSQPHQWGLWVCDGYSGEYATLVRICPVAGCGASDVRKAPLSGMEDCVAEIGLHVPKGDGCGCKCGKGENLDSGAFHFWDGSDIVRGVTNCLCVCGAKHVFREPTAYWKNQHHDEWCEGVCQSCRRRLKDGRPAAESDHTPKPRSKRRCGCRCGWFGVDQEHTDGGREAKTQRMHPQCMVNNTGDPSSPPYCKCFGTGNGGRWHYHEPFPSSSCPAVCQYLATGDSSLGHLAAGEPSPTSGGTRPATAAHHKGKAYGCGCRCGRCGERNRPDWKGNDALHRPAQNAADQCHCSCESRRLVGSGKGGHEFAGTSCTCTCGKTHRSSLNACGLCLGGDGSTSCGKIHRNGELLEDTADNHRFDSGSCTCRCGLHTRAHDWGDDWRGEPTTTYCPRCGAQLDRYPMWRTCKRCGLQEQTGGFQYSGAHRDGCTETGGDETTPPAVDECGECGHIAPGHYPSCSQYASGDQGETDDTGSIGEI